MSTAWPWQFGMFSNVDGLCLLFGGGLRRIHGDDVDPEKVL